MHAILALLALVIDAACGYPAWLYQALGHPVSWMGRLIAWCEAGWNGPQLSPAQRRFNGVAALFVCIVAAVAASSALVLVAEWLLPHLLSVLVLAAAAATLLAQRSLFQHVALVAAALQQRGLAEGRDAVAQIVGRDTSALDAAGIARAAIESLAENFSDGVVAPVFWLLLGGLPGAALYKTVNTADSMIGHKSERYRAFGWASARLDDLLNLPASRLAALWIVIAAAVLPDTSASAALGVVQRDARRHRSPNAGWPEAALAGALGLKLAGPRVYDGVLVAEPWLGEGSTDAGVSDISRALRLYGVACGVQASAVALLALALSV